MRYIIDHWSNLYCLYLLWFECTTWNSNLERYLFYSIFYLFFDIKATKNGGKSESFLIILTSRVSLLLLEIISLIVIIWRKFFTTIFLFVFLIIRSRKVWKDQEENSNWFWGSRGNIMVHDHIQNLIHLRKYCLLITFLVHLSIVLLLNTVSSKQKNWEVYKLSYYVLRKNRLKTVQIWHYRFWYGFLNFNYCFWKKS